MSKKEFKKKVGDKYLVLTAAAAFALLGLVASINVYADPFFFFRAPSISPEIHHNPLFREQIRTSKANQLRHAIPCAVVIGSSRSEYGLDPAHPGWGCPTAYNLSVPSANIYEVFRLFQHIEKLKPQGRAILGLDYFMFNLTTNPDSPDFVEQNLAVDANDRPQSRWDGDMLKKILSEDVLLWSFKKIMDPNSDQPYRRNGFRDPDYKSRNFYNEGGHRKAFMESESSFYDAYSNFIMKDDKRDNLAVYRKILEKAYTDNVDMKLVISPVHARQIETVAAAGDYELWEEWKRQMMSINLDVARQMNKKPFPIWDFTGYANYEVENVPPLSKPDDHMKWFWESSHYKKELGDKVLDRVFDYHDKNRAFDGSFGVLLTPANIEAHFAKLRRQRSEWRSIHPQDVKEIEALKKPK